MRTFREVTNRDTTTLIVSIQDLASSLSSPVILNVLFEGIIIYDKEEILRRMKDKVNSKLNSLGVKRVKEDWGYSWIISSSITPFKVEVDIKDPQNIELN